MNKEIFNKLLQAPYNVNTKHKQNLKKLVENFPYATNIRLLYLSCLLNDTDVLFEQELNKTAAYISDRSILKNLISKSVDKNNYIIAETELKSVSKSGQTKESELLIKNANKEVNEIDLETKRTNPVSDINENELIQSSELTKSNRKGLTNSDSKSTNELDKLIVSSAINASISSEINTISEEINKEDDGPRSFLDWIEGNQTTNNKSSFNKKQKERNEFKERAEILINNFIKNQPKIKPKVEFYSPENMARKSIEDSEEIVTETLANIYSKQGNIAKAKSIYKQLILKNPEKKTYFATLIKDLNTE